MGPNPARQAEPALINAAMPRRSISSVAASATPVPAVRAHKIGVACNHQPGLREP